jgi:CRISPR-associated protein Cas1
VLARLIPSIDEMLASGELPVPEPPPEAAGSAFEELEASGDAGRFSPQAASNG